MKIFKIENISQPLSINASASRLYLTGGYHSESTGCLMWGSSDDKQSRFIGDDMGKIKIEYSCGEVDEIPLIMGITLWFHGEVWSEKCAPFKSENEDENDSELISALKQALQLYGAFEDAPKYLLGIRPRSLPIKSVSFSGNEQKGGHPVFFELLAANDEKELYGDIVTIESLEFLSAHTVNSVSPITEEMLDSLDAINRATLTFEEDFASPIDYSVDENAPFVKFEGSAEADIATAVYAENKRILVERTDEDGFIHTSFKRAPSWRYCGFGPWVSCGNYYDFFYSRDAGRAIITLAQLGEYDAACRGAEAGNRYMMYFPKSGLTFGGKSIPAHAEVVPNMPLFYSKTLVPDWGWPTKYTKERFGEEYQNLGNQETDGHGFMMLSNYFAWLNAENREEWLKSQLDAVLSTAEWIDWCFENPELSLARDGLLYAESEAGMNEHTLYCNMLCALGLRGYAKMAESIGLVDKAKHWESTAQKMEKAMTEHFSEGGKWKKECFGFYHDPVLTMCADFYGWDLCGIPEELKKISLNTYRDDVEKSLEIPYDTSGGFGYNTSMITQNALLNDRMDDATLLVNRLTKLCYAPRLPFPFIVPEGGSYSNRLGAIRRQGDLGNLVQQAEGLKTLLAILGISAVRDGKLSIYPRLPRGWSYKVKDFCVMASKATVDIEVSYPENNSQSIDLALKNGEEIEGFTLRFGPFDLASEPTIYYNGKAVSGEKCISGDSLWVIYKG